MTADLPAPSDSPPASVTQTPRARHSLFVVLIVLPLLVALGLFIYQQVLFANRFKQELDQHNVLRMMVLGFINNCAASQSVMPSSFNDFQGNALYSWRLWMPAYISGGIGLEIERVAWNDPRMVMRLNNTLFPGPNATAHLKPGQTASREFGLYCFYPNSKTGLHTATNILAVTGPDSLIRDPQSARTIPWTNQNLETFPSTTLSNLILFLEVFDSGVHWMEPVDLVVQDKQLTLRGQPFEIKVPDWARGFHVAFPDYATWLLDKKTPVDALIPLMKLSTAGKYDREKHLAPYILNKYPQ